MKLYIDPICIHSRKVLATAELLDLCFEKVELDTFAGEHKRKDYLAINPNGTLPCLVDGDFILWESNAIIAYLAQSQGEHPVYPNDRQISADIQRWCFWEANQWYRACYIYVIENIFKPITGKTPDTMRILRHQPAFLRLANVLEQRLAKSKWLCADHITIADIAVAAPMHLHRYQKLPLQDFPHIRDWIARLEDQRFWQRTDPLPLMGINPTNAQKQQPRRAA